MKIADVESILVEGLHFVRVRAEDGTTGVGQSADFAYPEAVHAIAQTFKRYLVGQDARRIEHHWHHLYRMAPFRGSTLGAAISAVDIALWDLKGKALNAPVWELLGGRYRDRIRLHLLLTTENETLETLVQAARAGAEEGFTAVKFNPLPGGYQDMTLSRLCAVAVERTAAVREAVGTDVDLIFEIHRTMTPLQFPTLAHALREFQPLFVEDPIQIDSIQSQGALARRVDLPIANGERLFTIWEFRELLEAGGAQFVRPDLGLAGGFSQCRKIAAIAEAHHAAVCTHNFLGPLLTAASVHLDAAIPNFVVQEYTTVDEGRIAAAFPGALQRSGGYLPVPETPGIGVELDETKVVNLMADVYGWDIVKAPRRADGSIAMAV